MWKSVMTILGASFLVIAFGSIAPAGAVSPGDTVGAVDTTQGLWYLRDDNTSGVHTYWFLFGGPGDLPLVGDWNCDGWDTPGYYRPSTGRANMRNNLTTGYGDVSFYLGQSGDVPLAGDFNGDGCDTVSLYRPSEGRMFVFNRLGTGDQGLGAADYSYYYGNPIDQPFVGDFDGDGIDTVGVHRESTGQIFLRNSNTQGIADIAFYYGNPDDRVMSGDWAQRPSSGVDTVGLFRPADRTVYLRFTNTPGPAEVDFLYGSPNTIPIAGTFQDMHGSPNAGPPLNADLTASLTREPMSGECEVVVTWNWGAPLHADITLWDGSRTGGRTNWVGIVNTNGTETSFRLVFDVEPDTYTVGVDFHTPDDDGQRKHWIGSASALEPGDPRVTCG